MAKTIVVNRDKEREEIYIGREEGGFHFGNPFTHLPSRYEYSYRVPSREEAIIRFRLWIRGDAYRDVEPERRRWILSNLYTLRGKKLGCFCKPKSCHGDIYIKMLEGMFNV
jgi:hypothetical protein